MLGPQEMHSASWLRSKRSRRGDLQRAVVSLGFPSCQIYSSLAAFELDSTPTRLSLAKAQLSLDHPVFHAFYDIREILQVPNVYQARGGPTHELDGYNPHVRGIFDDQGRLMVLINWNTDLGDAWEWADNPRYPLRYSTYAYELGINFVIYAMSH